MVRRGVIRGVRREEGGGGGGERKRQSEEEEEEEGHRTHRRIRIEGPRGVVPHPPTKPLSPPSFYYSLSIEPSAIDPALAAPAKELERHMRSDSLHKHLKQRPSKDDLAIKGILGGEGG